MAPKKKHTLRNLVIIVAVVLIAGRLLSGNNKNESQSASVQETQTTMVVNYHTLYNDYQANPIKADSVYKGKLLKLTGKVDKIDREIMGEPYVTFAIDNFLEDVRLTFQKSEEDKVASLVKGQTITVVGKCKGTLLSTTVVLDECEFSQ
jgi:hypothetical protein